MTDLTILCADDNSKNLQFIRLALRDHDYILLEATNGREAIEIAMREHPAMIFMDISMPELNGLEATKRLKALPEFAHTPIIALTSNTMPGDREACLAAGCAAYLMKPVMRLELLKTIATFSEPAPIEASKAAPVEVVDSSQEAANPPPPTPSASIPTNAP